MVLNASETPQYFTSPTDYSTMEYVPNSDCKAILRAQSTQHRIQINILKSELEEPIFEKCNDYCSFREGKKCLKIKHFNFLR